MNAMPEDHHDHRARTAPAQSPRIAICGEIWSTNLGDAVIADSLAYLVMRCRPDADISFVDISGRPGRSQEQSPARTGRRLRLGPPARWWRQVRELGRSFRAWASQGPCPDTSYDLTVIGGGQLLMDNDLWFPSRLWLLHHTMAPHTRAFAIHACGVGDFWSPIGRWLCSRLLADTGMIARSVRDPISRERAERHLGCPQNAISVVPDPALWAAEAFQAVRDEETNVVGAGIMSPPGGMQGADSRCTEWLGEPFLLDFWRNVINGITSNGHEVHIFTNGAPEDHAFAVRVYEGLPDALRERATLLPRPTRSGDLVRMIASFRGIVAQRLHALIIGYSLSVPAVGLVWDDKVQQFGIMTGHPQRVLGPATATPAGAVELLFAAMAAGVNDRHREELRVRASDGVRAMLCCAGLVGDP